MYILENLKLFGLNKYEALAYIQIVKSGVATAKEVSRGSDVPYSRTYDVLDSLEKKEWVLVEASKPYRYRAEKIDVILDKKEKIVIYELEEAKKRLIEELLPYFNEDIKKVGLWTLRGTKSIHYKVLEIISSCGEELDTFIPFLHEGPDSLDYIEEEARIIKEKLMAGVKLRLIVGREIIEMFEKFEVQGVCEVRVSEEHVGWIIISDSKEVLYGVPSPSGSEVGIWSDEPEMVRISGIMFNYLWEGSK